LIKTLREENA